MLSDIKNILKHCLMCGKFSSNSFPSNSVIPCDDGAPYKKWTINVIDPMLISSQNKRYIVNGIDFYSCWLAAQAVARQNGNFIRRLMGQKIIKKFNTKKNTSKLQKRIFLGYTSLPLFQGDLNYHHKT